MLVPSQAPKIVPRADYLVDDEKFAHLARTKLLVNLHQEHSRSFEWVRVLQAIANGCVVVSEPSLDDQPLVPGEHFAVAAPASIPHVVEGLLQQPERLRSIRTAAYDMLRGGLEMLRAIERLIATAESLVRTRKPALLEDVVAPEPPTRAARHLEPLRPTMRRGCEARSAISPPRRSSCGERCSAYSRAPRGAIPKPRRSSWR